MIGVRARFGLAMALSGPPATGAEYWYPCIDFVTEHCLFVAQHTELDGTPESIISAHAGYLRLTDCNVHCGLLSLAVIACWNV